MEQPLLPYEACNLGSINVGRLVLDQDDRRAIDWETLRTVVHWATRLLDDVIEQNKYPIPEIEEMTTHNRRIGLGLMGWADLLYRLRIPYNSEEALALAEQVMAFIDAEALAASEQLAAERGSFANWEESIYGPQGQHWPNAQGVRPLRNATVTTIAPTGSISIIAGASGGIEPLFGLVFRRQILDGDQLLEVNPIFEQVAKEEGFYSAALLEEIAATGSLAHIAGLPDWVKQVFVTARDISPEWHVRMQAAFQKCVANATSKTCNLPATATEDDVRAVYDLAYRLGCKGVTIYRDGSRAAQPMATVGQAPTAPPDGSAADLPRPAAAPVLPRPLPDGDIGGWMGRSASPQGTVRLWISEVAGQPYEAYVVLGKAGSDLTALAEGLGRLLSIALRAGIPVETLIDQLRGIGGSRAVGFGPQRILSVPDAIAKLLQQHYGPAAPDAPDPAPTMRAARAQPLGDLCPECGNTSLIAMEGCRKCPCGHSEC